MSKTPNIIDGLTYAETMKLGLDYYEEDKVQNEVSRFVGINIDLIDNVTGLIKEYESFSSEIMKEQSYYEHLMASNRNPDKIAKVALSASGVYLFERKNELKSKYQDVTNEGTTLSLNLVSYLKSKIPETKSLMISGTRYWLDYPVVTRKSKKSIVVYADGDIFRSLSWQIYNDNKVYLRPEQMTTSKHPDLLDWTNIATGLIKVTKL